MDSCPRFPSERLMSMFMLRRSLPGLAAIGALALTLVLPAAAQQRPTGASGIGRISGRVTEAGAPVPFANVRVITTATTAKLGTLTDENGNFIIPAVPAGPIQVEVAAIG